MPKRTFIANFAFTLVLNVLVKPIWVLLIDRQVQLEAGHETYGLYAALMSLALMLNILLDIGLTNYNQRQMAAFPERIHADFFNMLGAKVLLGLVYSGVLMLLGMQLGYSGMALNWLFWVILIQLLNSLLLFLRSCIAAQHDFLVDGILSVLDKGLVIALGIQWWYAEFNLTASPITWFLYAQAGAYAVAVLMALGWIGYKYRPFHLHETAFAKLLPLIKESLPYALLILCMAVYMRIDSVLLERLQGGEQAGRYAATYRLLDMANMLGYLMAGILLPLLSRMLQEQKPISTVLFQSANILMGISLAVMAFGWVYAEPLMQWLYPDDAHSLGELFRYTFAMFPAFSLMYLFASVLTARGDIRLLLNLAGAGALAAVVIQWLFIPRWQAEGAAWGSLLVEWGMALAYMFFARQKTQLVWPNHWVLKLMVLTGLTVAFNALLLRFNISWYWAAVLNMPVFLVLVYAIQLWQKASIVAWLHEFRSGKMGD